MLAGLAILAAGALTWLAVLIGLRPARSALGIGIGVVLAAAALVCLGLVTGGLAAPLAVGVILPAVAARWARLPPPAILAVSACTTLVVAAMPGEDVGATLVAATLPLVAIAVGAVGPVPAAAAPVPLRRLLVAAGWALLALPGLIACAQPAPVQAGLLAVGACLCAVAAVQVARGVSAPVAVAQATVLTTHVVRLGLALALLGAFHRPTDHGSLTVVLLLAAWVMAWPLHLAARIVLAPEDEARLDPLRTLAALVLAGLALLALPAPDDWLFGAPGRWFVPVVVVIGLAVGLLAGVRGRALAVMAAHGAAFAAAAVAGGAFVGMAANPAGVAEEAFAGRLIQAIAQAAVITAAVRLIVRPVGGGGPEEAVA